MRYKIVLILVPLILLLSGCPKLERNAYNTVVASKAFLDSVKNNHPECSTDTLTRTCKLLRQATSAKDLLIDAGEEYCSGGQFETGGPCNPPTKGTPAYQIATDKLRAALASYNAIERDLKGAL